MDAQEVALVVVRLVLGVIMIAHGYNHWRGGGRIAGTARWFEGLGLRHGKLQAWASVVTEIGAGAAIAAGFLTPFACGAVISVMVIAGLLAHRANGFFVFKEGYEYVLLIAVVAVALAALGPGTASVDHLIGTELTGWGGGGVAVLLGIFGTATLLALTWRPARGGDAH
ncbi:DoxX family protein [Streptomyces sp. NPDC058469]|uniref:DoxX family protein n=1 Tax=Streptomyces sp. NPDC058469 TaxID=3346514 RepID=UPI0036499EBF